MISCLFDEELDHSLVRTLKLLEMQWKMGQYESRERAVKKYASMHCKSELKIFRT